MWLFSEGKEIGAAMNGDVGDGEGPGGIKADSQEVRHLTGVIVVSLMTQGTIELTWFGGRAGNLL